MSEGNWQTASQLEMYPLEWTHSERIGGHDVGSSQAPEIGAQEPRVPNRQGAGGGVLPEREKAAEPRRKARKETTRGGEKAVEKEQEKRRARERPTRGRAQRRSRAKCSSHRHSGAPSALARTHRRRPARTEDSPTQVNPPQTWISSTLGYR